MSKLNEPGSENGSDVIRRQAAVLWTSAPDPVTSLAAGTSALSSRKSACVRKSSVPLYAYTRVCPSASVNANIARSWNRSSPSSAKTGLNATFPPSSVGADRWIALFHALT
jgi:hypothetical protein